MTATSILLLLLWVVTLACAAWWRNRAVGVERRARKERAELQSAHEEALHAQTTRMEAMLDSMVEGLVVLDSRGRIVLANHAAEWMFNFSRMMVGGTVPQAIRNHEVAALAAQALEATSPIEHEVQIETPKRRVIQISAVALRDAEGGPAGAVMVFHDVTQLRQLEAMRQDFVANVSHELRTPLSLIRSAAETLIDGGKNDPQVTARFLDIIDKHASRLTFLIDDLLLLARLDSGRIELKLQPVSLQSVAQEALDDAALIAKSRNVTLRNEVPAEAEAQADPERLRQVLANLIDNAIKYGRADGQVAVRGRRLDVERVQFSVCDDGPGIPFEAKERVFERFYRVDKARSREQGGTGLGLAIVKNVVEAHGGEVRVESEPGRGTEFFITMPAAKSR